MVVESKRVDVAVEMRMRFVHRQFAARRGDHRRVHENPEVAFLVRLRQSAARHTRPNAAMVAPRPERIETEDGFAQTRPAGR